MNHKIMLQLWHKDDEKKVLTELDTLCRGGSSDGDFELITDMVDKAARIWPSIYDALTEQNILFAAGLAVGTAVSQADPTPWLAPVGGEMGMVVKTIVQKTDYRLTYIILPQVGT